MSQSDLLCAVEWEAEASWCENSTSFATARAALTNPIDVSGLSQDRMKSTKHISQMQGGVVGALQVKDGEFTTRMDLVGHGVDTDGAVTIDEHETFIGYQFGNPSLGEAVNAPTRSASSSTNATAGSTTTSINTAASGTIAKGSLVKIGTAGLSADGRGSGQFYPVASHTATVLALRHATITAPNNLDKIRAAVNHYLPEVGDNTIKGLRMRFLTPDQQYFVRGAFRRALTIGQLNPQEHPFIETRWGVSDWDSTTLGTWPSPVTRDDYNPAPIAGGSCIIGDVGSTVRTAYDIRAFSVSIELGVVSMPGHDTVGPFQRWKGAYATPSTIRWSLTLDAPTAAAANIWEQKFDAGTRIWINNTLSATPGSAMGLYMQNCHIDRRPKQVSSNGINSIVVEGCAYAGSDLSTNLSQAALVLASA